MVGRVAGMAGCDFDAGRGAVMLMLRGCQACWPLALRARPIIFFRALLCIGARRNPATCGTHQALEEGDFLPSESWWDVGWVVGMSGGALAGDQGTWAELAALSLSLSLSLALSLFLFFSLAYPPTHPLSLSLSFSLSIYLSPSLSLWRKEC